MKTKIVCEVCGEETTSNKESSWYGEVHKWGPRDHTFKPKEVQEES